MKHMCHSAKFGRLITILKLELEEKAVGPCKHCFRFLVIKQNIAWGFLSVLEWWDPQAGEVSHTPKIEAENIPLLV